MVRQTIQWWFKSVLQDQHFVLLKSTLNQLYLVDHVLFKQKKAGVIWIKEQKRSKSTESRNQK